MLGCEALLDSTKTLIIGQVAIGLREDIYWSPCCLMTLHIYLYKLFCGGAVAESFDYH